MPYQIILRNDTAANWSTVNPTLAVGELGIDVTNRIGKLGDGSSAWSALPSFITTDGQETIFGTGADGDVTISGTVTLTRDMTYRNLTVPVGTVINTAGFRVFVNGTLTGSGTIQHGGGNGAAGGTAGTAAVTGYYGGGTLAGTGGIANGNAATAMAGSRQLGSTGGTGGNGTGGTGGIAGTTSPVTAAAWGGTTAALASATTPLMLLLGRVFPDNASPRQVTGGTGGGGGAGDGTAGGGGGGGGGVCVVFARDALTFTGLVTAFGGNGGTPTAGNRGGGGGGGGGLAALITSTVGAATVSAPGGNAGTGSGTGTAGTAGTNGVALLVLV